jgi:hypothetical protein
MMRGKKKRGMKWDELMLDWRVGFKQQQEQKVYPQLIRIRALQKLSKQVLFYTKGLAGFLPSQILPPLQPTTWSSH